MKLYGNFFMPFLDHYTFKPIPNAIVFKVVVTENFYVISYLKFLIIIGWGRKWNC